MTYDELVRRLQTYGMTVGQACADFRNRTGVVVKSWEVRQYAERQGTLSSLQSAFFTAYLTILELEKGGAHGG